MDSKDRELIELLRDEARLSLRELGAKVALSAPAVAARLKRLEETGVIRAYRAVIDEGDASLRLTSLIYLNPPPAKDPALRELFSGEAAVSRVLRLFGPWRYLIEVHVSCVSELNALCRRLEGEAGSVRVEIVSEDVLPLRSALTGKSQAG